MLRDSEVALLVTEWEAAQTFVECDPHAKIAQRPAKTGEIILGRRRKLFSLHTLLN